MSNKIVELRHHLKSLIEWNINITEFDKTLDLICELSEKKWKIQAVTTMQEAIECYIK